MNILPYKLDTTNDQLTSRAGLLTIAQLMASLNLSEHIDHAFLPPGSNRGFKPSEFIETLILMQHEGGFHLNDVRYIRNDEALRTLLNFENMPGASALGNWLRRTGKQTNILPTWQEVNKVVLKSALHKRKALTLDIDASEIIANKYDAKWTYKKNKGYMPMLGHIAETGQVVACDFRPGNASPARENLEFIQQCEHSLPKGHYFHQLRIDAAGYQAKIIEYCDQNKIEYAIRAKASQPVKEYINELDETDWQPMINRQGESMTGYSTCRTTHVISQYEKPFTLDLNDDEVGTGEEVQLGSYIYRAIATNKESWDDSRIIHWYNQRGEDSENRIKELKLDFGGNTLPCTDFKANALYFMISALSYNLFALMRQLLPEDLAHHRAITIRWRVYAVAAKVVKTGRQWFVKLQAANQETLQTVLDALRRFDPPQFN